MLTYVCCGFGEPLHLWLDKAASIADGVRIEIPNGSFHEDVVQLASEIAATPLHAIYLVNGWLWLDRATRRVEKNEYVKEPPENVEAVASSLLHVLNDYGAIDRSRIEVGNEINLDPQYRSKSGRRHLHDCLERVEQLCKAHKMKPPIAANVSNLAKKEGMRSHSRSERIPSFFERVEPGEEGRDALAS